LPPGLFYRNALATAAPFLLAASCTRRSAAGNLPHRWVRSDAPPTSGEARVDDTSLYGDLAKLLYSLNGHRPGPVRGFYVIVEFEAGRYAVGQLCADPAMSVQLFEDLIYTREAEARTKAAELRAAASAA